MSYIHKPARQAMDHRTFMHLFDIRASSYPMHEAFVIYNQAGQRSSYTFQEIQQQSLFLAASFLRLGWKRGQRVALFVPDRIEILVSYMALLRIGVNVIHLSSQGSDVTQIIDLLKLSKCQGLVVCASHDDSFNTSLFEGLIGVCESSQVVLIDAEKVRISKDGYMHYNVLLESGKMLDVNDVLKEQDQVQMDDPAFVIFTSGTTGQPKGVQHSNHFLVNVAISGGVHGYGIEFNKKGHHNKLRIFIGRPIHSSEVLMVSIVFVSFGYTLISAVPLGSNNDAHYIMDVLQNERCTNAYMMQSMIKNIVNYVNETSYDLSSLKGFVSGGEPFQPSVFKQLRSKLQNCNFFNVYGLTEVGQTASQILNGDLDFSDNGELDILPNYEIKIVNDELKIVPIGEVGEICIRSPFRFLEYIEKPDETRQAFSPTGWYRTGDMGLLNGKGKLVVYGRRFHMIQTATTNVFPLEVEKILADYPDVVDVAVIGNVEASKNVLCACVVPKKRSSLESSLSEFKEWIKRQFASDTGRHSTKPNYFQLFEVFPKNSEGKVDRNALRNIVANKFLMQNAAE